MKNKLHQRVDGAQQGNQRGCGPERFGVKRRDGDDDAKAQKVEKDGDERHQERRPLLRFVLGTHQALLSDGYTATQGSHVEHALWHLSITPATRSWSLV